MTTNRPYLLRAFYEWIVDNTMTPYIVVDSQVEGVVVPSGYADENGQIVLNVGPSACQNISLGNSVVTFSARFRGQEYHVYVPINALIAIYARENGRGTVFAPDPEDTKPTPPDPGTEPDPAPEPPRKRPALKIVK